MREAWLDDPRGRVAYVIVLDQFPRNMFRGTARMFEGDRQALAAAVEGIARHDDVELNVNERSFLYMPFMHSEDIDMQDRSVALFTELAEARRPSCVARWSRRCNTRRSTARSSRATGASRTATRCSDARAGPRSWRSSPSRAAGSDD